MNNKFNDLFDRQNANQYSVGNTNYKERIKKLNALKTALETTYKEDIRKAMYDDFKKPYLETDLTEIYPVISEIKFTKRQVEIMDETSKGRNTTGITRGVLLY